MKHHTRSAAKSRVAKFRVAKSSEDKSKPMKQHRETTSDENSSEKPSPPPPNLGTQHMMPWKSRVIDERGELADKLKRLKTFLDAKDLVIPDDEKARMDEQHSVMTRYLEILDERIKNF